MQNMRFLIIISTILYIWTMMISHLNEGVMNTQFAFGENYNLINKKITCTFQYVCWMKRRYGLLFYSFIAEPQFKAWKNTQYCNDDDTESPL